MIPELAIATVLMMQHSQHSDPLNAALDWHSNMNTYVEKIEAAEEAAAEEAAEEAAAEEAEAEAEAQAQTERAANVQTSTSRSASRLPALLMVIRANESGGDYGAVNNDPGACEGYSCYGAYQMHGLYMDDWASRYGAGEYAGTPASEWPPEIQDRVALGLFLSTNPDGAQWCDWADYC